MLRRRRFLLHPLAAVLIAMPCAAPAAGETSADIASTRGEQLATALCASCHLRGTETEKIGPSGVPGFRAVANRSGQTPEQIARWLRSAPPMMPNHHLTQDEIEALAAYIMSLRTEPN